MRPPDGSLVKSRVVEDPGTALATALDRSLTGYVLLEPQESLLLDADGAGLVAVREGVPVGAHHLGTGRSGPPALADLAVAGPSRLELRALADLAALPVADWHVPPGMPAERLAGDPDLADRTRERARSVAPGQRSPVSPRETGGGATPADPDRRHSGTDSNSGRRDRSSDADADPRRRDRPADSAPGDPGSSDDPSGTPRDGDAVAAFLDDEEKIDALRERARAQARDRAAEWGLDDQLVDRSGEGR